MPRAKRKPRDPVDELVDALARPIYVLRMAHEFAYKDSPMGRGAAMRAANARRDIREVVERWVDEQREVELQATMRAHDIVLQVRGRYAPDVVSIDATRVVEVEPVPEPPEHPS